ncbi:hypothetical protein PTTG_29300 [Puccinia triticina 1-1 BBBD Race 1]|uniref:Uncharacterized protein n=1 Tax=Puccinia triticina (isolate 1-1 / race 1 (BBBD)) TaxID=630390 RepID=A0A180G4Z9_PUCT1|nr:hypothetical protein PTTG_29300 [Puccinia triticina 1-1 BBBD Race 1]
MPSTFSFNQTQLHWIKAMQERIDRVVDGIELPPDREPAPVDIQENWSRDWKNWNHCFHLQCKLDADAFDHKIPHWAIPNVKATWMARRNRFGRGPVEFAKDATTDVAPGSSE